MSKILDRLRHLYELAKLRPEEENNEARMNEARTSAFLLLKIARENNIKIIFREEKIEAPPPPRSPVVNHPPRQPYVDLGSVAVDFNAAVPSVDEFFRTFIDQMNQEARSQHGRRRPVPPAEPPSHYNTTRNPHVTGEGAKLIPTSLLGGGMCVCKKCGEVIGTRDGSEPNAWHRPGVGTTHGSCGPEVLNQV